MMSQDQRDQRFVIYNRTMCTPHVGVHLMYAVRCIFYWILSRDARPRPNDAEVAARLEWAVARQAGRCVIPL